MTCDRVARFCACVLTCWALASANPAGAATVDCNAPFSKQALRATDEATKGAPALPSMSADELYVHIACGWKITARTLRGKDIVAAVARVSSSASTARPVQDAALEVENSLVVGGMLFAPSTFGGGVRIAALAEDQKKHFAGSEVERVAVVPIPLTFRTTRLTGKDALMGLFATDTVFAKPVVLERSIVEGMTFTNAFLAGGLLADGALFSREVTAQRTNFGRRASFAEARFTRAFFEDVDFRLANFSRARADEATFTQARFGDYAVFSDGTFGSLSLERVQFRSHAAFDGVLFVELNIYTTTFEGDAIFLRAGVQRRSAETGTAPVGDELAKRRQFDEAVAKRAQLLLIETRFKGLADFRSARIPYVYVSQVPKPDGDTPAERDAARQAARADANVEQKRGEAVLGLATQPTVFEGETTFARLQCTVCNFARTRFLGAVDFAGARFARTADFNRVSFVQDVNFVDASFPPRAPKGGTTVPAATDLDDLMRGNYPGLIIEQMRSQRPPRWDWGQLEGSVNSVEKQTYQSLEDWFTAAKDARAASEAAYRKERLIARDGDALDRFRSFFDFIAWGHGHRPSFALAWIVLLLAVFTALYRTQTRAWKPAFDFAVDTSWRMGYGIKNSRGSWRAVTIANWISMKALAVVFVLALSKQSPLLNEIVKKLLPI